MGAVDLDGVQAQGVGAARGRHEGGLEALQSRAVELQRRGFPLFLRQGRGGERAPAAVFGGQQLTAVPRQLARRLAPGVGDLHGDLGVSVFADGGDDRAQRRFGAIVPQAEVGRRDAAFGLDRGRLDDHHAGARHGHRSQVHHVPVGGRAVIGRILAHRRDDDAVGKLQIADFDRGKQGGHMSLMPKSGAKCRWHFSG